MFNGGTRVILIASSCKKSTGPKRGSIGFTSAVSGGPQNFTTGKYQFIATNLDIYFTRFGFEQKSRFERKPVVALIPVASAPHAKAMIATLSNDITSNFEADFLSSIKANLGVSPKTDRTMAIVAPVINNGFDLMTCDENNLTAWVHGAAENNSMSFYHKMAMQNRCGMFADSDLRNSSLWTLFHQMTNSREKRDDVVADMLKSKEFRELMIRAIRVYQTMTTNANVKENFEADAHYSMFANMIGNGPKGSEVFNFLTNYTFKETFRDKAIRTARIHDNSRLNSITKDFIAMVSELVLSACVLESCK